MAINGISPSQEGEHMVSSAEIVDWRSLALLHHIPFQLPTAATMPASSVAVLSKFVAVVAILLCVSSSVAAASLRHERMHSALGLLETAQAVSMPDPMTATCQHGPYQLSGVTIAPKATQKLTIASCIGKRVQTTITGLTAIVADDRNIKIKTLVNGKSIAMFSAAKVSCFQKPTGVASVPTPFGGSVVLEITCLDKKRPCSVNLAWSAECKVLEDDSDDE